MAHRHTYIFSEDIEKYMQDLKDKGIYRTKTEMVYEAMRDWKIKTSKRLK
jgi:hypothetical protein